MLTLSGVVYHENLILFPFVAEEESWHKPVVICVKLLKIVDQCPHVYVPSKGRTNKPKQQQTYQ